MSKILVTGGAGFIGSNLIDLLLESGSKAEDIYIVDNLATETGKKENINSNILEENCFFKDIRDIFSQKSEIPEKLKDVRTVFHLAALARIQPSFKRPIETYDVNSLGTFLVCEYARKIGAKLIYSGSSSFYAGPHLNPYAFSKWSGEEVCKLYSKVYDLKTGVARFFNVYGPRQPIEGVYATVVGIFQRQWLNHEPLTVTGDGEQRRDFTHVNDICRGLLAISKGEHNGDIFNLGREENYSINELANFFADSEKTYIDARPGEARESLADISFTREKTGWTPSVNLGDYVNSWTDDHLKNRRNK